MGAYYIVTDLDLQANFDLSALDFELTQAGLLGHVACYDDTWSAVYSNLSPRQKHPSEAIKELIDIVEGLSSESRDIWERCTYRRFDMGFYRMEKKFWSHWVVDGPELARLAAVRGDLVITIYQEESIPFDQGNPKDGSLHRVLNRLKRKYARRPAAE